MTIYRPLKTNSINQKYGKENTNPTILDWYHQLGLEGHNGWDFGSAYGEPVYFPSGGKGKVITAGTYADGCMYLKILEGNVMHRFLHLKDFTVQAGEEVESGDLIAHADNTGKYTTGSHLHYDLSPVHQVGNGYEYDLPDNGYGGQADIEPYYKNIFIVDYVATLTAQLGLLQKVIELLKQLFGLKK